MYKRGRGQKIIKGGGQRHDGHTGSFIYIDIKHFNTVSVRHEDFGLSGVRALPLAAGTNEGGHFFW